MLRRLSVAVLAGLALFLGLAGAASGTPPVSNTNDHEKNFVETFDDFVPSCEGGGPLYHVTVTSNLHEKETVFADGTVHATFTQSGKVVATPVDTTLGLPSYTGNVTAWGNFNITNQTVEGGSTFHVNLKGSDGSTVSNHAGDHFNVRPDGSVHEFMKCH